MFGEIGYRITPELRVSLGARHFDYRLRETFYAIDQFFGPDARDANGLARTTPIPEEYSFGRADDDDEIYRLNASYDLTDDDLAGVPLDERQYDPDSIVSYEVGGKMSLVDRQVYLSTAVYYIDWSDIQTLVPTDLGFTINGNAGKATARGFELELQSRGLLADDLSLSIGYSYTDVQLEQSITDLGLKGDRAPRVPEHAGSLMADYEIKSDAAWTVGINVSTSYTGRSASAFGPLVPESDGTLRSNELYLEQEAYWLTNIAARFQLNAWTVRLFVDNVLNEDVDLWRARELSDSQYRSPYVIRGVNQPRTIGVQLTWDLR